MDYIVLLKNLLGLLKLGDYEIANGDLLNKAAQWALNSNDFKISPYKPAPLRPILSTLKGKKTTLFRKAEKLSVEVSMPSTDAPNTPDHYNEFKNALQNSKDKNLLTVLEVYGSTLAVNEKFDDISLFEWINTTIGIACCIQNGNDKLRLAGGSISGIQTYLYEIVSKNAAKLLKGRSFYIQLLVDSALEELISKFNLSSCHVIYSSGGGFYVFMPDSPTLKTEFTNFSQRISESIYKKHKIALSIDLALTETFDISAKINKIWDELFTNLNKLKFKRLNNNPALFTDFFNTVETGGLGEINRDPITNEEFGKEDTSSLPDKVKVLISTKQQIELGKKLREADYWITTNEKIKNTKETIEDPFGKFHYLVKNLPNEILSNHKVLKINGGDEEIKTVFYGGNEFPYHENGEKKGEVKSFDELAKSQEFERLAILRMDVDGLGAVFSEEAQMTSSKYGLNWLRYVCVSRSLDLFFKGYLNQLQREVEQKIDAIDTSVIIYSGGDDLFLVGRWDTIIALSEGIYKKFKAWTDGVLTISGGIEILPSKFPIMQGAKMTAEAEHNAKKHTFNGVQKNAITILGKPLNWEHEFPLINKLQEDIFEKLKQGTLNKSVISKINIHAEAQDKYNNRTKSISPKWMWVMAYDFARFEGSIKDEESKKFIKDLQIASISNQYEGKKIESSYPFLQLLQVAARWAELRHRADKKEF